MTDVTGYRLANAAGARRIIEVRDEARRRVAAADEAILAAVSSVDADAMDAAYCQRLLWEGKLGWAEGQLREMAVFAVEGA